MPTAVEYSLAIDGIPGESQAEGHKGEIEIDSFSFGVTQVGNAGHGSGAGAGKASFQDIHFAAPVNVASPKLLLACASGQHFKKAVISARKAGEKPIDFLKITLTDVLVSGYALGSNELDSGYSSLPGNQDSPSDQFSLNFNKIQMQFTSPNRNPDGTPTGASSDTGADALSVG